MVTDDVHQRHTVQDVSEEGNIDRVNHVLDIVYAATVEMLYPYTKEKPLEDEIFCEHACRHEYFVITMQVPETISRTTLHLLQKLIHEYMVCKTVADWMSITNPAKAQTWGTKAKGAEREIRSCLNARMTRVRRRCHPF